MAKLVGCAGSSPRRLRRRFCTRELLGCIVLAAAVLAWSPRAYCQDVFESAVRRDDIDAAQCRMMRDGNALAMDADEFLAALGIGKGNLGRGIGAGHASGTPVHFAYLVCFKSPVKVGTVLAGASKVRILKPDAAYPPDPNDANAWIDVDVPASQPRVRAAALPPDTVTRALLLEDERKWGRSQLNPCRLLKARLHNIVPDATAQAESEYIAYSDLAPPQMFLASRVTKGTGAWQNCGPDEKKIMHRPPVSDMDPSWFCLTWDKPQTIVGVLSEDTFQTVKFQTFAGNESISPAAGVESEWKLLRDAVQQVHDGRWVALPSFTTRGLRLMVLKTSEPAIARIDSLSVFTDLGAGPVPERLRAKAAPPPCTIGYKLDEDEIVTMAVDDANGQRVRNVVARVERLAGDNAEAWDLCNMEGRPVPAGTYTWKAIVHPPLQLKYEMTPYPNIVDNSPQNSAWENGHGGTGGWQADHTPPTAVCATGNRVYMGSACPESGVGFIACDGNGAKQWAIHSFAAWSGARLIAADGNDVFAENGNAIESEGTDRIWQIDTESHSYGTFLHRPGDQRRRSGVEGIVARGGKLFVSVNAKTNWLDNAAGLAETDIENCIPRPKKQKETGLKGEPDPRSDFLRLFRLKGQPPGYNGLTWLESEKGPGRQQHVVMSFAKPIPLGGLAFPIPEPNEGLKVKLSILKPDAPYPPVADDQASWTPLADNGRFGWNVVSVPPNTFTRAVRITFLKGADDALADIMDHDDDKGELKLEKKPKGRGNNDDDNLLASGAWSGRLEGMKLLRRRFENLFDSCKVRVNSGYICPDSTWEANRTEPLTEENPGVYLMEWPQEQSVRGLAIKEIDGKRTEIDVFTGPAGAAVDLNGKDNWKHVSTYVQQLRDFYAPSATTNSAARYMDGYVDFGSELKTRAIRLRVVEQWTSRQHRPFGVRSDRGGCDLQPNRCRVYGVAPVKYLGGEPTVDPLIDQRIEVYDIPTKKLLTEVPADRPGMLALNPAGDLYALCGSAVMRMDLAKGDHQTFISDLVKPMCIAFDSKGNLYAYDDEPNRQAVRVYDPAGKYQRDIGIPGGYVAGPWDGKRFRNVRGISIDKDDRLWVAEACYWPKRVTQWKTDGTLMAEFLGNTAYGGGGSLDPWDKRRVFYGPMEFELDWKTGLTRLKNLTYSDYSSAWHVGDLPIKIGDRTYLTKMDENGSAASVWLYDKDRVRPVAAFGRGNNFPLVQTPEVAAQLKNEVIADKYFIWNDLNGDGKVQFSELTFIDRKHIPPISPFARNLDAQAGHCCYHVKEFLPNGVPVYEFQENPSLEKVSNGFMEKLNRLDNGNYFRIGNKAEAEIRPDGSYAWTYPTEGCSGFALPHAKPWRTDQVVCEFYWVGHETAPAGDLGEFAVIHTNVGAWNIWTADGLLAGNLFRDLRDPKCRAWSMPQHDRGMILGDITPGQEHFQGYFTRTFEDNKFYVVAGHNHASVVEVVGMDKFKRIGGKVEVDANSMKAALEYEKERARQSNKSEVKIIDCYHRSRDIKIDGSLDDWDAVPRVSLYSVDYLKLNNVSQNASFAMTYDDENLYVSYDVHRMGPLANQGNQWDKLFKTGAAVDLQMSVDPNANAKRNAPVHGDFRLLMTEMNGKPIAVLYRPVVPGTPEDKVWKVVSPVNQLQFDEVKVLPEVKLAFRNTGDGYVAEAAIPLASIGLSTVPGSRLKVDWGMLTTDTGTEVLSRTYWSNKATTILADAPSEASMAPDLWGFVRFFDKSARGFNMADPAKMLDPTRDKNTKAADDLKLEDDN